MDIEKMKNILIVNTRSDEKKLEGFVMWGAWAVASYFKKAIKDSEVIFLDENNEDNFDNKFEEALKDRDTVGFSLTSMQIKYSLPRMRYIRTNYPNIKILVGGIHPALFPNQDYGGLVDEAVTYDLPKTDFLYELLPDKVLKTFKKRGQVVTGFNCSYKCAFCVNSVRNCRYEPVEIDKIFKNIDYMVKEFKPKKIYFRDEDFFQDIKKARIIVNYIIEKGYKFNWDAASRVSHFMPGRIDDNFLKLMLESGCKEIRFGIESGSQRILNYLKKGQTVEQIKYAIKQCVKYDIHASCSMIIGLPKENEADREETYKLISELSSLGPKVEILGPQVYRPYPGGLLYEEIKKYGFNFPKRFADWENYYDENPVGEVFNTKINYPWLTKKENKFIPLIWVVAHYGLNYRRSKSIIKKIIGFWFWLFHWKLRYFGGWDMKIFMYFRKLFFKLDIK